MNLHNPEPIDQALKMKLAAYKFCMNTDTIIKPKEKPEIVCYSCELFLQQK
jgi:hypothetical protein